MRDSRHRLLRQLQADGAATVAELARAIALEPVTVRHHLGRLRAEGLVEARTERCGGRGRPHHVYRLSASGAASLEGGPMQRLSARLLDLVSGQDRRQAERFFSGMADQILAEHAATGDGREPAAVTDATATAANGSGPNAVERGLDGIIRLLEAEGFEAYWERDGDSFVIHQGSCPFGSLSQSHPSVCCMDLALIEGLATGQVERESWRPAGDPDCAYRLRPGRGASS